MGEGRIQLCPLSTTITQQRRFRDDVSDSRLCPEVANLGRATASNVIRVHQRSSVVLSGSDSDRRYTPINTDGRPGFGTVSVFICVHRRFHSAWLRPPTPRCDPTALKGGHEAAAVSVCSLRRSQVGRAAS